MVACIIACLAFMALGRRWYRMPIDFTALARHAIVGDSLRVRGAYDRRTFSPAIRCRLSSTPSSSPLFGGFAIRHFGLLSLPSAEAVGRARHGAVNADILAQQFHAIGAARPGATAALQVTENGQTDHAEHVEFLGLPFCLWTQAEVIEASSRDAARPIATWSRRMPIMSLRRMMSRRICCRSIALRGCRSATAASCGLWRGSNGVALPLVTGSDLVAALLARLNARGHRPRRSACSSSGRRAAPRRRSTPPIPT